MLVISFCMRSAIPGYMVEPPERTVLAYKSLRMSMSHFMMELKHLPGCQRLPFPRRRGGTWTRGSGSARCRR